MQIESDKLIQMQGLYEDAYERYKPNLEEFKRRREQYLGSKKIDTANGGTDEVNYVRNITFELIESQISTQIPPAQIRPYRFNAANHALAKTLEHYLNTEIDRLPFEKLNDIDERNAEIYGGSIWLVEWDDSITTRSTQGGLKVSVISPEDFIPQPFVTEVNDMDYSFVKSSDTYDNICRKYNVEREDVEQANNEDNASDNQTVTVITCYYKDEKGLICKYTYADTLELEDIEDYWGRKTEKCAICGGTRQTCTCEKGKGVFEASELEEDEITEDLVFFNGLKYIPSRTPVMENGRIKTKDLEQIVKDEYGNTLVADIGGTLVEQKLISKVPVTKPTKVPFYKPSRFPIVIRKSISFGDDIFGLSGCDIIRDQQQTTNKLESRINEKTLNAGVTFTHGKKTKVDLTSDIFKTGIAIENLEEKNLFGIVDCKPDITGDMVRSENVYKHAQRTLGISDSYMGQEDSSADSGYAKQIQVQQTAGRFASKRVMKNAAYAEIYERMFQLTLAFADEPRPISYKDTFEGEKSEEFNRYAFLELDKAGEWYYNDEFIFATSKSEDLEKNRLTLWQEMTSNLRAGTLGNPTDIETLIYYWGIMDSLHYPRAAEIKTMLETKREKIMQAQELAQATIAQANKIKAMNGISQQNVPISESEVINGK